MSEQKQVTIVNDPIYKMLAQYKPAIASVLPKHLTPEKALRIAHTMITRIPKLRDCTPVSLINSVIEISILGLEVGRTAHIIPFKTEATVIVDYKGLIELAHRSDKVTSTPLKPVYENDFFEYEEGTQRYIKHKPAKDKRGKLIAAYAIVNFKDGGYDFEVVLPEDIESVKKRAPGAKKPDSPWNTSDEWTMWCKTAMRRLAKRIPQSPELQKAAYLEEIVEAGLKQNLSHVTDNIVDADFKSIPKSIPIDVEKTKAEVTEKLKDLDKNKQTDKEIDCPNQNYKNISTENCNTCEKRIGCPSWE